jgi:hypothetical protein
MGLESLVAVGAPHKDVSITPISWSSVIDGESSRVDLVESRLTSWHRFS